MKVIFYMKIYFLVLSFKFDLFIKWVFVFDDYFCFFYFLLSNIDNYGNLNVNKNILWVKYFIVLSFGVGKKEVNVNIV